MIIFNRTKWSLDYFMLVLDYWSIYNLYRNLYRIFVILTFYCHNPGQPKTKSPGVVLLSVRKPHHHTTPGMITIQAVLGNLGSWLLVCSFILTQLEDIWKTTSIFLKMEDDLNYFEKGRRPQFFFKWKMTSKK